MLLDAVYAELQMTYGNRPASLREGQFLVNEDTAKMFSVLFDSGALHHSYISASIVEKNREAWASMIRPYEAWVKLADQKTVVKTKEVVKGMLSFVDDDGKEYSGEVEAIVWEMKGLDFILGLPDIVKSFIHLFFMMLKQSQLDTLASSALESPLRPGQVIQWSDQVEQEAPEESECPMPVAHEPILTFMETSYEDAL